MQKNNFDQVVDDICEKDHRYHPEAYSFVREGLDQTLKNLKRSEAAGADRHVSGPELLEGLRRHTLEEFGPLGRLVLNEWGLFKCRDFGQIVFNLVSHNVLGRSESDSIDDFQEIFSFEQAFEDPFRPDTPKPTRRKTAARATRPAAPKKSKSDQPKSPKSKSNKPSSLSPDSSES
ncbi:MAG: Minf_1886 family protein [Candidatus Methylacidiphilales bacterium]